MNFSEQEALAVLLPQERRHALDYMEAEGTPATGGKAANKKKKKVKKEKKKDKKEKKKKKKAKKKKSSSSSSSSSSSEETSSSSSKAKTKKKQKKEKKDKDEKKQSKCASGSDRESEKPVKAVMDDDGEVEVDSPEPKRQKVSTPVEAVDRPAPTVAQTEESPPEHAQVASALERLDMSMLGRAVAMLSGSNAERQEHIAIAIAKITPQSVDKDGSIKSAVGKAGAIPPLVALLKASTLGLQKEATRALHNLTSKHADNKVLVVEAGGVRPLLLLLRNGAPVVREQASGLLRNLAGGSQENKAALAADGAIGSIVSMISVESSPAVQANFSVVLYNLANGSVPRRTEAITAGALRALVVVMKGGVPETQREAADTLRVLADKDLRNCQAIVGEGVVHPLGTMLKADAAPKVRQQANLLRNHLREFGGSGVKAALAGLPL